ncbi:MAG: DNA replication/repair protein RecF [Candidatus Oxydemutatoraceae bacterium WSBS_2016_MAG_OTU14]
MIKTLSFVALRNIKHCTLDLSRGSNIFFGENGAGKTTLLEAVDILAHGRSFRATKNEQLIQKKESQTLIAAKLDDGKHIEIEKNLKNTIIKIDGKRKKQKDVTSLLPICRLYAGSEKSITGGKREQQGYLDWGVFHMKQQAYQARCEFFRAVQQRNALLQSGRFSKECESWDKVLVEKGQEITEARSEYVDEIQQELNNMLCETGQKTKVRINYVQGWPEEENYAETLKKQQKRDVYRGLTHFGPHRARIHVFLNDDFIENFVSRGQQKMILAILTFAQARHHYKKTGKKTILLLDDIGFEFDRKNITWVLSMIESLGHQTFITWADTPPEFKGMNKMFHVKQGVVSTPIP